MQKNRVYLWDNLKFFLILLVVVGHFLTQYLTAPTFKGMWLFIYSFHMPLFLFVSGAFHKNNKIAHKVLTYTAMYVVYKVVVFISRYLVGHKPKFELLTEGGAPWYMLAMAVFILLTYLLRRIDLRYVLVISVIVACFVGYDQSINQFLSLSRIFVFYPFYLMGVLANKDTVLTLAKKPLLKVAAIVVILAWLSLCLMFREEWWPFNSLLAGENPFNARFYTMGFLWRFICMVIAFVIGFAAVLAVPTGRLPVISTVGARTLQIYFWHRPPLYFIKEYGLTAYLCATAWGKGVYLLLAVALTLLLALKLFSFPTAQIMKYRPSPAEKTDE